MESKSSDSIQKPIAFDKTELFDSIFEIYNKFKEFDKRLNFQDEKWTVLAAFVLEHICSYGENTVDRFHVISFATGNKCIGRDKMKMDGSIIHDSHAEILARRSLVRFLMEEIKELQEAEVGSDCYSSSPLMENEATLGSMEPSKQFQDLWKKFDIQFPGVFLPIDDACGHASHGKGENFGSERKFCELSNEGLEQLLKFGFPKFLSHTLYNPALRSLLESFINFRQRAHERSAPKGFPVKLARRIFMVYFRAVGDECEESGNAIFPDAKSSQQALEFYEKLLIASRLFNAATLMDLCAVYGGETHPNRSLLQKMLNRLLYVAPTHCKIIEDSIATVVQVLFEIRKKADSNPSEACTMDVLDYVVDITSSMKNLVQCHKLFAWTLDPALRSSTEFSEESFSSELVRLYDHTIPVFESNSSGEESSQRLTIMRKNVLSILHEILQNCFIDTMKSKSKDTYAEGFLNYLMWLVAVQGTSDSSEKLLAAYASIYGLDVILFQLVSEGALDEARVDYLMQSIEVINSGFVEQKKKIEAKKIEKSQATQKKTSGNSKKQPDVPALIKQVQEIFDFGEAFIEACLAFYSYNVEQVVAAIAEDSLPPQLERLDRSMGKVWVGKREVNLDEDKTFKNLQRRHALQYDREEEQKAYLTSMYDDDYDDQWEEVQGLKVEVGGSSLMTDLESIKQYNKFKRQEEAEDAFWSGMSNKNRRQAKETEGTPGDEESGQSSALNVEKGKRSPNSSSNEMKQEHRNNSKETKQQSRQKAPSTHKGKGPLVTGGDSDMSKLQKRRKDKNKAKIANHNRKSGANKKMSRGMF